MIVPQLHTWKQHKRHLAAAIRTRIMRLVNRLRIRRHWHRR